MRIGTYQLNQSDRRDGLVFASYSEGTRDVTQEGEVERRSTVVACYLWFMFGHVGGVETKLLSPSFSSMCRCLHIEIPCPEVYVCQD
jgi:hypothetical protein